jgi:RHH-type proline utilization regulon transcriptional repressor/proline dehydrogenase/delta 1-pyrroline-5-carboxylate dehydrogenase
VDSSALSEQVTGDVLLSAFGSAGQRCSALRLLLVQDNVADHTIDMIAGAMGQLRLGDPARVATDVGPVIDDAALAMLLAHAVQMRATARQIAFVQATEECSAGTFFAPCAFELNDPAQLTREVFGPILHIARYRAADLESVVDAVNNTGYGLTFGMHSRIDSKIAQVAQRIRAGNVYVNRGMTGAVVGVQPFGGEGLSGTGPKAGGPHYLLRFASEKTLSINTTAAGGNATLLAMS